MATGIEGVRPAVIETEIARSLDEYLRFRHLFRNIYGFELEWDRCQELFLRLPAIWSALERQLAAFDGFLLVLERET
jgi:hypothetical protein